MIFKLLLCIRYIILSFVVHSNYFPCQVTVRHLFHPPCATKMAKNFSRSLRLGRLSFFSTGNDSWNGMVQFVVPGDWKTKSNGWDVLDSARNFRSQNGQIAWKESTWNIDYIHYKLLKHIFIFSNKNITILKPHHVPHFKRFSKVLPSSFRIFRSHMFCTRPAGRLLEPKVGCFFGPGLAFLGSHGHFLRIPCYPSNKVQV